MGFDSSWLWGFGSQRGVSDFIVVGLQILQLSIQRPSQQRFLYFSKSFFTEIYF